MLELARLKNLIRNVFSVGPRLAWKLYLFVHEWDKRGWPETDEIDYDLNEEE